MFEFLATLTQRRRWTVVIVSVVLFAAAGVAGAGVADRLDPYGADDPDTESVEASDRLEEAGYRGVGVVVLVNDVDVTTAAGRERVDALADEIAADEDVAEVNGFADTGSKAFVSEDQNSTYLAVRLSPTDDDGEQEASERIVALLEDEDDVLVGGAAVAQQQVNDKVESDLQRAELYAFPIIFLLSLLFFRSLVAAALPLLVGGLAIVGTILMLRVASELTSVSIFALNIVTGLGLGLAIDYSLFMVSRYREEIARTGPGLQAMRRTLATAGRTVLFSSLTVAGAMAALIVFPQRFLYSMGLGGMLVALMAATVSLIVLPAVLAVLGNRVNALAPKFLQRRAENDARPATEGFWYRLAATVGRMPGRIAIASATVLIVLGLPFLNIVFTWVDPQVLPADSSAHQVDDALQSGFPPFRDNPIEIALRGTRADAERVAAAAADIPEAASVAAPTRVDADDWVITVASSAAPLTDTSEQLVADLRALPGSGLVGGFSAGYVDLKQSLGAHIPLMLAIVALTTFLILFLMTGSVVLPIKQLLMNLLGLSAVFGILVLIFQDGRLEGLLGFQSQGGIETTMPLLLFATVFGLSTDYGVFLLARIKEAHDGGLSNSEAVAVGLERTGRIVTAAAVLFAVAVGAFVTSEIIFIKEAFLGISLAVLIDASIVRALLVPALMNLLGGWNWWAPRPLRRLHARIGLSEA